MSRKNLNTRKKILEATWQLLETDLGAKTRMSDIAKTAGISRQALYLHYPTRAELLIATARYLDEIKDIDQRLLPSRNAPSGSERLDAFIDACGNYIPEVYGVCKAFISMKDTDEAAAAAWHDRMEAVRQGCEAAIKALKKGGMLKQGLSVKHATDLLWTLLSVRNWEQLTIECGWPQARYIKAMKTTSFNSFVA